MFQHSKFMFIEQGTIPGVLSGCDQPKGTGGPSEQKRGRRPDRQA